MDAVSVTEMRRTVKGEVRLLAGWVCGAPYNSAAVILEACP